MNWGKPDFDSRSAAQQQIDREAPALRERLKAEGKLYIWPHNELVSPGYPPSDVKTYCVEDAAWQKIRLSMKGIPTHEKLQVLNDWWVKHYNEHAITGGMHFFYKTEVQVGNYLGALRRGGQLDYANRVRRYI
ncbi:hypothetical protein MAINES_00180 [Brevundimonas phage vB_BpoS-MaInes]|nr:hypothetical protein MAINES_00180 [Brevundimonas phage vB_BpoS-MaInes]